MLNTKSLLIDVLFKSGENNCDGKISRLGKCSHIHVFHGDRSCLSFDKNLLLIKTFCPWTLHQTCPNMRCLDWIWMQQHVCCSANVWSGCISIEARSIGEHAIHGFHHAGVQLWHISIKLWSFTKQGMQSMSSTFDVIHFVGYPCQKKKLPQTCHQKKCPWKCSSCTCLNQNVGFNKTCIQKKCHQTHPSRQCIHWNDIAHKTPMKNLSLGMQSHGSLPRWKKHL